MTPDEILAKIREARAICDAATLGPWEAEDNDRCWQLFAEQRFQGEVVHPLQLIKAPKNGNAEYWPEPGDSRFIAAARTGWPEALDIIEQLVAKLQDWEAAEEIRRRMQQQIEASRAELDAVVAKARRLLGDLPDLPVEPPPGKMRVTGSVPVTYDVSPGQIAAYLRKEGWVYWDGDGVCRQYRNINRFVIVPIEAVSDELWRLDEALALVAEVESRSTGEVLRDIAAMEEA